MEIIIHGTKGGYKVLSGDQNAAYSLARDVRRIDGNASKSIGQFAYSISFPDSGCAFSKYIIIQDVQRNAAGFIAFSVFISGSKRISGKDILDLLDKLGTEYCDKYVDQNNNLDNIKEDWSFVHTLAEEYGLKEEPAPNNAKSLSQGNEEAAYIYYNDEASLVQFFDEPYQDEYSRFRQVLYVDSKYIGNINSPLNAMRHDTTKDLTGKISFYNPKFTISLDQPEKQGIDVKLSVNGSIQSNRVVYMKDKIAVTFSKLYHKELQREGRLHELSDIFDINENKYAINIKRIDLQPETKEIKFHIKTGPEKYDRKYNEYNIEIKSIGQKSKPAVHDNIITFTGDQIGESWTISIRKNEWSAKAVKIPDNINYFDFVLEKKKSVKFLVSDGSNAIHDYQLKVNNESIYNHDSHYEFTGDEVNKKHKLTFSHSRYKERILDICPINEGDKIDVLLIKNSRNKKYETDNRSAASDQPSKGSVRKFINKFDSTRYKVIFGILGIAVIFCLILLFLNPGKKNTEKVTHNGEIENYVNGIILNSNALLNFKNQYCKSTPEGQKTFFSNWFGSGSKSENSNDCQKIEKAMQIREAITKGDIDRLKAMAYSKIQDSFKNAILRITADGTKKIIGSAMKEKNSGDMNLNEVAVFINNLNYFLSMDANSIQSKNECDSFLNLIANYNSISAFKKIKDEINQRKKSLNTSGVEGTKAGTKATGKKEIAKNSIDLGEPKYSQNSLNGYIVKKFWELVENVDKNKWNYDNLLDTKGKQLSKKETRILKFLNKICKDDDSFEKFKKQLDNGQVTKENLGNL